MPLLRRNPHECAVAKKPLALLYYAYACRNPHECAVAKDETITDAQTGYSRNPHECAVAKWIILFFLFAGGGSQPARMRCGKAHGIVARKP